MVSLLSPPRSRSLFRIAALSLRLQLRTHAPQRKDMMSAERNQALPQKNVFCQKTSSGPKAKRRRIIFVTDVLSIGCRDCYLLPNGYPGFSFSRYSAGRWLSCSQHIIVYSHQHRLSMSNQAYLTVAFFRNWRFHDSPSCRSGRRSFLAHSRTVQSPEPLPRFKVVGCRCGETTPAAGFPAPVSSAHGSRDTCLTYACPSWER